MFAVVPSGSESSPTIAFRACCERITFVLIAALIDPVVSCEDFDPLDGASYISCASPLSSLFVDGDIMCSK
jgi:hypothetical protein